MASGVDIDGITTINICPNIPPKQYVFMTIYIKQVLLKLQEDTLTKDKQSKKPVQYTIEDIIFPINGSAMTPIYTILDYDSLEYEEYLAGYFDE